MYVIELIQWLTLKKKCILSAHHLHTFQNQIESEKHFDTLRIQSALLKKLINVDITRFLLLPHTKMKILTCYYDYRVPNLAHPIQNGKEKTDIFPR